MKRRISLPAVAIALLTACSSSDTASNLDLAVDAIRGTQPDFTPRFIELLRADAPVLDVSFIEQDSRANLLLDRRDGAFEYWLTSDGAHLILQSGMLHGTRGLGEGLLASDIDDALRLVRSRQAGTVDRLHTYLDGNDRAVTRTYRCVIDVSGPATITLPSGPANVSLMTERCRSLDQVFTNFYWVVPKTGQIVQSRQWSGPELGAMSTRTAER